MSSVPAIRRVLSIAGSDSGGGAGIQADLKAFARCGVHGMTAVTAVTAQNTLGVDAVHPVPPEIIVAQIRSVAADIGIDAIKIGMLGDSDTVAAVAGCLLQLPPGIPVVVDPVLLATTGAQLLAPVALAALLRLIVPLATVLTPNLPEARALVAAAGVQSGGLAEPVSLDSPTRPGGEGGPGRPVAPGDRRRAGPGPEPATGADGSEDDDAGELARALHRLGPAYVVVTGGHRPSGADLFFDGLRPTELTGPRHPDGASHGSGCTHSAALAAALAHGSAPLEAARFARAIASAAVGHGLRGLGRGDGPVDVLGGRWDTARRGPDGLP
jgi:hydroxymethylpyrimidine/phosphomethylpyrimidine kinase